MVEKLLSVLLNAKWNEKRNKKQAYRKLMAIVLTVALMLVIVPTGFITDMSITASAATNGLTQAQAVEWIRARKNEQWAQNYDGSSYTVPQCVDLIVYYFNYLGVSPFRGYGNAYSYADRSDLPSGWYYTSSPSAGDIAVWKANIGIAHGNGHVALVESVNGGNFNYVDVNGETGKAGSGTLSITNPSSFIHPDFSSTADPIGSRNATGDFNGDGRGDYAVLYDYGKNRAQVHVFLSTGADFSEEVWWRSDTVNSFDASRVSGRFTSGDFNGDGKDDIAMMYQYTDLSSTVFVLLSNGSSFNNQSWKSLSEYKAALVIDRFIAGDFNGDGRSDIATMYEYDYTVSRIHVFLSNGNSFADPAHWLVLNEYCASKLSGRFVSGDFNGDGKDDIAAMYDYGSEKMGIHVFLSKANSFSPGEHWYVGNSYIASKVTGRFAAGDFNGDNVDDLAAMYDYGNQVAVNHVWLSQKTKFAETQHWFRHNSFLAERVTGRYFGCDVNGDNKSDIVSLYYYNDKSGFHVSLSNGTNYTSYIWNQISGYDCSRTVGIKSLYDENYSATFNLTKKTIPCSHIKTGIKNTKAATCCENGYTGDTYCTDCGEKIASGTIIPATGNHTDADGEWETDETQHWHTCYYGTQFDVASHIGGTATCTEKSKCSVCGVEYGDYTAHTLTHHNPVAPDYENNGNIEYWTCDECGKYYVKNGNTYTEIEPESWVLPTLTAEQAADLDGDGVLNAEDMTICTQALLLDGEADVNGDGVTNILDLIFMKKVLQKA